jgi:hypothetical protein
MLLRTIRGYEMENLFPVPWRRIEEALKTFGGWSRIFATSVETYELKNVIMYESDSGFWIEYAKVLAEEEFREEVRTAYKEFVLEYGKPRPRPELMKLLARALLEEGWQPNQKEIQQRIRNLKHQKMEEIQWLKRSLPRKQKRTKK